LNLTLDGLVLGFSVVPAYVFGLRFLHLIQIRKKSFCRRPWCCLLFVWRDPCPLLLYGIGFDVSIACRRGFGRNLASTLVGKNPRDEFSFLTPLFYGFCRFGYFLKFRKFHFF
jgi:hypothetical protein